MNGETREETEFENRIFLSSCICYPSCANLSYNNSVVSDSFD